MALYLLQLHGHALLRLLVLLIQVLYLLLLLRNFSLMLLLFRRELLRVHEMQLLLVCNLLLNRQILRVQCHRRRRWHERIRRRVRYCGGRRLECLHACFYARPGRMHHVHGQLMLRRSSLAGEGDGHGRIG